MNVTEIFNSLQGEGKRIGYPTTFVRLFGCNLRCFWCDTGYAKDKYEALKAELKGKSMTPEDIANEVPEHINDVCFTGGEPLLQKPMEFRDLLSMLKAEGKYISIETNGTLLPDINCDAFIDDYTVSPKLKSSGYPIQKEKLKEFVGLFRHKMQFKFIIQDGDDIFHMKRLLDYLAEYNMYVPTTVTPVDGQLGMTKKLAEDTNFNAGILWGYDIRYLPQLHKIMGLR